jgi:hypothetical protein
MNLRNLSAAAALALALAIPSAAQFASSSGTAAAKAGTLNVGIITQSKGNIAAKSGEVKSDVKKGRPVKPGMLIESEEDSETVLAFPDGQVGVLGQKGSFRINGYAYDPKDLAGSDINLSLIEGVLRVVMGEIAQTNPSALRLQVGTASVSMQAANQGSTDASMVSANEQVAITVNSGTLQVRLPTGSVLTVLTGQTLILDQNGTPEVGPTADMLQTLSGTRAGQQIQAMLQEAQSFGPVISQTVATMSIVTNAIKDIANGNPVGTTESGTTQGTSGQQGASTQAGTSQGPSSAQSGTSQGTSGQAGTSQGGLEAVFTGGAAVGSTGNAAADEILVGLVIGMLEATAETQQQPQPPVLAFTPGTPNTTAGGGGGNAAASPN